MAKNLYVTLLSGRTFLLATDWNGVAPIRIGTVDASGSPADGHGIEVGEYYRNLVRSSFSLSGAATGNLPFSMSAFGPGTVIPAALNYNTISGPTVSLSATPLAHSDDIDNIKPHTWQKVATWLVWTCADGTTRLWRAASVDGWSDQPPLD